MIDVERDDIPNSTDTATDSVLGDVSNTQASKAKILLVDDDESLLRLMSIRLTGEGYDVSVAESASHALKLLYNRDFDVVLSDLRMPGMDGIGLFDEILKQHSHIPVIIMTAHGSIQEAVSATQRGVFGFVTKPVDHNELKALLNSAVQQGDKVDRGDWAKDIITRSPIVSKVLEQAGTVANKNVSVLITGDSGSGKELLANAIHKASPRRKKSFVAINCGALPENLLESELFGHTKGAFTGAVQANIGLFKQADGGTLFLDEIGDMPMSLQVKLLRALQERKIRPVGSTADVEVDVRVISATHKNLKIAMQANEFREDLYYRLNVVDLHLPTLKERFEDIPLLAEHFLKLSAQKHDVKVTKFSSDAIDLMTKSDWPGNVRQLVNVVERCVALTQSAIIPAALVEQALSLESQHWPTLSEAKDAFEYSYLSRLLKLTEGNVTKASTLAGRNRTDMHKLMKKHGLDANQFR